MFKRIQSFIEGMFPLTAEGSERFYAVWFTVWGTCHFLYSCVMYGLMITGMSFMDTLVFLIFLQLYYIITYYIVFLLLCRVTDLCGKAWTWVMNKFLDWAYADEDEDKSKAKDVS